jgi:hypothetical protein
VHAAGAGDGEACPWESTKDDKIEPSADGRIDRLVYDCPLKGMVYRLSEDEIKIVES